VADHDEGSPLPVAAEGLGRADAWLFASAAPFGGSHLPLETIRKEGGAAFAGSIVLPIPWSGLLASGSYEEIAAFRDFMGYTAPWYSNAHLDDPTVGVAGRISCYLRREDKIYLTYWTTGRGDEVMSPLFGLLDMTAYGRKEEWEDSPEGWPQFPTHSFLRTDEHGAPMGPRNGGRPVPQWTRPGVTGVGVQTG